MIEASLKVTEGMGRKLGDSIFDARMKYASEGRVDAGSGMVVDEQKIGLIQARINEMTALARQKFKEGTKESVDDARRLWGEVEKLTTDLFDQQTKKRRTEFDEMVRRGQVQPSRVEFDPVTGQMKAQYEFRVQTAQLERQLKSLADERLAAEQKLRAEKQKQMQMAEQMELREKERVKTIQQAISELEKIKVMDDKGQPTERFKRDPQEALAEFDRQAAIARQAASQLEIRDRLATLDFINKQREALEREVNTRMLGERSRTEQEAAQMQLKIIQDRITQVETAFDAATGRIANNAKKVSVSIGSILAADVGDNISRFQQVFNLNISASKARELNALKDSLRELGTEAKRANEDFAGNKTKENLDKATKALDAFIEKYREFVRVQTGQNIEDLPANSLARRRFDELTRQRQAMQDDMEAQAKAKADLESLRASGERMKESMGSIPDIFGLIAQAAGQAVAPTTQSIDQIVAGIDRVILKAKEAAREIANMGGVVPPQGGGPNGYFGGQPRTYAFGGRGSDDQLAFINAKERVMTSEAEANWSPLLRAMNAGLTPNQAMGGSQVTNVGDININMSAGAPASQNVRTFAKTLRRALRRGVATLD